MRQKSNMETKYTLIMRDNGSVVQLVEDGPVPPVVPGLFLVLDFTLGLSLNLVVVFTIITCPALRRVSFNRVLLHLCVGCALDCVLNLVAAVGFIAVTRKYHRASRGSVDMRTAPRQEATLSRRVDREGCGWFPTALPGSVNS
jgi:hypothetical protein